MKTRVAFVGLLAILAVVAWCATARSPADRHGLRPAVSGLQDEGGASPPSGALDRLPAVSAAASDVPHGDRRAPVVDDRPHPSAGEAENSHGFRVRVVDADGRPLDGVPLATCREGREDEDHHEVSAVTDGAGEARFDRLRWGESTRVRIALPLTDPVVAVPAAGSVTELEAPSLGALDFDLVDALDAPLRPESVYLVLYVENSDGDGKEFVGWRPEAFPCRLRLPRGRDYQFHFAFRELRPVQGGEWPGLGTLETPRRHRLTTAGRYPVLVGHLVTPGGAPCTGPARLRGGAPPQAPEQGLSCDAAGAFRAPVQSAHEPGSERRAWFLASTDTGFFDLEQVVDLSRPLPDEDIDLGEVVLVERPILVAGRVEGQGPHGLRKETLRVYERPSPAEEWRAAELDVQLDDGRGLFLIFGTPRRGASYRAHLEARNVYQVSAGAFEPGTRDFVIEVAEPAVLRTNLEIDAGVKRSEFALRLEYADSQARVPVAAPVLEFRRVLRSVAPGRADVVLQYTGGAELARREGVELRSRERTEIGFDLRAQLNVFRLSLEYSSRQTPGGRDVRVLFREGDAGPSGFSPRFGARWQRWSRRRPASTPSSSPGGTRPSGSTTSTRTWSCASSLVRR